MSKISTRKKLQIERMLVNHFEVPYIARTVGVTIRTVAIYCAKMNKIERVKSLYDAGLSAKQISEKTNICRSSVNRYIQEINQRRTINKVVELTKEGKSVGEIATELGIMPHVVTFYRKEYTHAKDNNQ